MASGAVWGGHLGVNYQFHGVLLVGAEVGYAGNWLGAMATAPLPSTSISGISANDLLTVTGRFGYVFHMSSMITICSTARPGSPAR
jgi:hypothetical protein